MSFLPCYHLFIIGRGFSEKKQFESVDEDEDQFGGDLQSALSDVLCMHHNEKERHWLYACGIILTKQWGSCSDDYLIVR